MTLIIIISAVVLLRRWSVRYDSDHCLETGGGDKCQG